MITYKELPDNLNKYAWGGSLAAKVFRAYKKALLFSFAAILLFGLGVGFIVYAFTLSTTHIALAIPISTWLWSFALLVIYSVNTRDVRVIRPGTNGKYLLDQQRWFKNAPNPFKESDARYENGRRVLWVFVNPDGTCKPFDAWHFAASPQRVSAAEVAGIEAFAGSVRTYAMKKSMTTIEQLRLGFVVLGIVALLFGIYIMSGRLRDDNRNNTVTEPIPATQSQTERRTAITAYDGDRDIWNQGLGQVSTGGATG